MEQSAFSGAVSGPEFLTFFSNVGDYVVNVRFPDESQYVRPMKGSDEEIAGFLAHLAQKSIVVMTFDDHPFEIGRFAVDLTKKILTLHCNGIRA